MQKYHWRPCRRLALSRGQLACYWTVPLLVAVGWGQSIKDYFEGIVPYENKL